MSLVLPKFQVVRQLDECLEQIQRAQSLRRAFMAGSKSLTPDNPLLPPLLDAVRLFNRLGIPYALIGGIAAMVHGRARFTDDVDFAAAGGHATILAANPEAMRACNFDPACTWKLYHASGVEIDIWKDEFTAGIASRAIEVEVGGQRVRVADVHDLVAMKLRAGRLQDDYDIGEIVRAGNVDEEGVRALVTAKEFSRLKQIAMRVRNE
jgi:hypothetical protein